jgi:hypothetical protein
MFGETKISKTQFGWVYECEHLDWFFHEEFLIESPICGVFGFIDLVFLALQADSFGTMAKKNPRLSRGF